MAVVIRGDRIVETGKSDKIRMPPGRQVLNATGKFLIAGLWDMNAFWYEKDYSPLFIANGVTGMERHAINSTLIFRKGLFGYAD